jgi:phage-related protein
VFPIGRFILKNMEYEVEYVELENNEKPFEEFVLGLTLKERAKIFETINYFLELKNNDLSIKEKLSKHLEDGIFELRTYLSDKIARTLYFYQKGAKIIITHGFIKKTQKSPRKEIEKAKGLRKLYNERRSYDKL